MCTFIMAKQKQKVTVPGLVGWTLLDTAKHHGLLSHCLHNDGIYDYVEFGEGPCSAEDHVVVEGSFFEKLPPMGYQERNILHTEVYEHLTPTCARAARPALTHHPSGQLHGGGNPVPLAIGAFAASPAQPPLPPPHRRRPAHSPHASAHRSRLATMVTLTKEMDGIAVIVPDSNPDLTNYM